MPTQNKNPFADVKWLRVASKVIFYTVVAVLLLIPTILALINYSEVNSDATGISSRASEVVLYDSEGKELYREHESEGHIGDTSLISIFNTFYNNMESVVSIPDNVFSNKPFIADITRSDGVHKIEFYFTTGGGACYAVDERKSYYKLSDIDSNRFLRSRYAELLYPASTPPTLKSAGGELILPTSMTWNYKNIDNTYMQAEKQTTVSGGLGYGMAGGVSFDFEVQPQKTDVRIYQNGACVFDGNVTGLDTLILDSHDTLEIFLHAAWEKSPESNFYGTIDYNFNVSIHSRAEFSLSEESFSQGEFVLFKATNITTPTKLSFTLKDSSFTPEFLFIADTAYTLIPHAALPNDSDTLTLTATYGVSSATFTVHESDKDKQVTQDKLYASALAYGMSPQLAKDEHAEYFFLADKLLAPSKTEFTQTAEYGDRMEHDEENLCFYTEYESAKPNGASVLSVGAGKVVFVGKSENHGTFVVVDMGLGLRVRYFNLSVADVRVGEYVAENDIIGKTGALFDGKREGFSLMLSCNNAILDIDELF